MQNVPGPPIYVDRCVFIDGYHVYSGTECPHGSRTVDEQGEIKPQGWTVQQ